MGTSKKRILIVEDHADTRRAIALLLNREGYDVRSATTVDEALKLCDQENFDLLISDIGLPVIDGLQLMGEIARRCGIKGIAFSGYASEEDKLAAKAAGFSAYLVKPADGNDLLRTIAEILKEPRSEIL